MYRWIMLHKAGLKKNEVKKIQKSGLTLIEINVLCEVPFYYINIIIINKIIWSSTTMTLTSRHEFDLDLKKIYFNLC